MSSTHFGFKTVDEKEKAKHVRGVFDSVASKYDVMNDLMSVGLHRVWKAYTVQVANLKEEDVLLIKNTVMRYETYKNKSHKVSIATLVKHLQDLLGIEEEPKDALKFLRTCIKDYIILTR